MWCPKSAVCLTILAVIVATSSQECNERYFEEDSFVCVCDETFCDDFPNIPSPSEGYYAIVTSSREDLRFQYETDLLHSNDSGNIFDARIFINSSDVRQSMIGFGGAFTDSAGINIATLSEALQLTLIRQYFSSNGLEYNFGRVPIAGTDFSTYPYSYDDVEGDTELLFFNLTREDHLYKIPYIKMAEAVSSGPIKLFASPWSPPSWMKDNGMFNGSGKLIPEMQQPWANYFVKFLDAYKDEGVTFWGLTVQNEPSAGTTDYAWNACHFTAEEERDFVKGFLGPALNVSGYRPLKLMVGDDSRYIYPGFIETILNDEECSAYSDGVAVHWYTDSYIPASVLTEVHNLFPDKFLLYTEACNGYIPGTVHHVALGSWDRGENYASDIINNINHWTAGWVDWNLALDQIGGPNWASNFADAPIITNEETNEFYKQPMFYVMGHFSKFIPEGSTYIASTVEVLSRDENKIGPGKIDSSSFVDPSGSTVTVVLNKYKEEKSVQIQDLSGNSFVRILPAKSIQTIIYTA